MNDQQLLRYSRQIMLPEVGIEGQEALLGSTMLLIGMGGLGAPTALYLAAAGVGHLIIADFDTVELSNLQRQIIHHTNDIGKLKVDSAKQKMQAINPTIKITSVSDLDENNLAKWVGQSDIVLDGTDNFDTRFKINQACVTLKKPLVSAAVIRFEGQLSVFKGYEVDQPCYQCLYSKEGNSNENCTNNGILAPVAGVLGTMQALQAAKVVLNLGEQLLGKLMIIDALDLSFRSVKISKDANCPVCQSS
ncbi:Molybdopterin-synthase adenylyltransferase (EC 2.7.7.80) [uncultured Gammaproteobacteria bacterium]|uniref:HesA/MoeB/ThiF family protein n=1 Tax=Bathymodiolus heckerae thiotrophic gill symbiont TaxID=1052212 RepID=UPI0010B33E8B|nr:molybdopterin-synthase adenylyltransferase MoeB [Bathymodiolus heckerae thiotrophic gill symbiont]CAC9589165.1 Molybdopterin-synthase adenylyltransferase (EC 2.7.7.80) [uncultured Gammaproteobacteria bacterium]CAC9957209.1 Molybdopterin-synthase adenylyltransferase (EC 2.7.7.80) [uncultured Gammaproteobacteria bacterium]CAC9958779.1 Molybdopterin-synthase adenylyltransferase (EC 2.7.7.80) [uncultured Gammaproteobacteria bacterium]SHN92307.1 Sulfur carrier protein adenylyltransferase ThiF [Ba